MDLLTLAIHQAGLDYDEYLTIIDLFGKSMYCDKSKLTSVLGEKKATKVLKSLDEVERNFELMIAHNINFITCNDGLFPRFFLEMPNPCYLFYYMGNIELVNNFSISIIGSRKPTKYGEFVANKFSSELSRAGVVIVSGFAQGIDSISHKGATDGKGKTIAVLGTPLNNIYPKSNTSYAKEIIESGNLIISEFKPFTETLPFHFVQRNRLISAISEGLLVVEAGEKSGTLTTVDFALEQGKVVFAVPGNVNSINSVGTNKLIKSGAKIVTETEDILEEYVDYIIKPSVEKTEIDLSEREKIVYDILAEKGLLTCEEIAILTNQNIKHIMGIVSVLELKEIIKNLGNNTYALV